MGWGKRKIVFRVFAALVVLSFCLGAAPAVPADFPRSVAIALFTSLAKEDIQQTVSILPRLLSSRLMALAGAEVVLLPSGEKPPAEAAREAKTALLLQGTVAKLGKGYSIDVTALDLGSGKTAGAFFAAASSEDEIIPQLGVLAGEISEKLFGVRMAVKQPPTLPPAALPSPPAPASLPPSAPAAGVAASALRPEAPPPVPSGPWEPKSIVKVGSSDKIPDEVFRVAVADIDGDGEPEIVATGRRTLWLYKVKGDTIVPLPPTRIARGLEHHFLNVEMFDADGDGKPEVFVTDLVNDRLRSFVLRYRNGAFESAAEEIPYYVVLLSDVEGKAALAGQGTGLDRIYDGGISLLNYSGGKVTEGKTLKIPSDDGPFGLNAVRIGKEGKFVYIDSDEHLRLWDEKGKTISKTKEYFSGARDEVTRGPVPRNEVGPQRSYIRGRVIPLGGEPGNPFLLVRQAEGNPYVKDLRQFKNSRLVLGRYDGGSFVVKGASDTIEPLITDAHPLVEKGGRGALVAASVLEDTETALSSPVSRLFLYRVQ